MSNARSIVYVDGFNFYYGMVRDTDWKWLDLQRYFELIRPDDEIERIRYFTSEAGGPARDRQAVYLQALGTLPKVTVHLGRFKRKTFTCGVADCAFAGSRQYRGREEKETDVALGVTLVDDAYQDRADRFVIVSGDSDLVPAIRLVQERFPEKRVVVYIPATRGSVRAAATEMRRIADRHRTLPPEPLRRAQLPATIAADAGVIRKPASW